MNFRRWAAFATGTLLAGAATVALPAAASAANPDFCPDRYVCVYRNANWNAMIASWNGNVTTARQNFTGGVASSWQNHSSYNWCTRDHHIIPPDTSTFVMLAGQSQSIVAPSFNDKADYAYRC